MDFLHQFTATHFVWLAAVSCFGLLAATVGKRVGSHLIRLNDNLEKVGPAMVKVEILWDKSADLEMFRELNRRTIKPSNV